MSFSAGYAQAPITPTLDGPVYLAGFGQNRRAESVHDDLYARALALRLDEQRRVVTVVVVALDLIGLLEDDVARIRARVHAAAADVHLLVACTHTHHGPDTIGLWGPDGATSGVDPVYMDALTRTVAATVHAALDALAPAALRSTAVPVPGVAKNARDPAIVDDELTCLQFVHAQLGTPLATWLVFPCHPEVLWDDNPHITSDYLWTLRDVVAAATGARCLAMVGALGGMMTPDTDGHTFDAAARMGHVLGDAALAALDRVAAQPVTRLDYCSKRFTLPLANPRLFMAMEAGLLPDRRTSQDHLTTQASLLTIDDTWLFATPGEVLPALGLAYKATLRAAGARIAGVIGLADDELGYILPDDAFVPPADYTDPGASYEESMSLGPETGPQLTAVLARLIGR